MKRQFGSILLLFTAVLCVYPLSAQDSLNVSLLGQLYHTIDYGYFSKLAYRDNLVYICDGDGGLKVINVANPSNPQIVGNYDTYVQLNDIFLKDNLAYVTAAYPAPPEGEWVCDVIILNIANLSNIQWIGGFYTDPWSQGAYVSGTRAFIAEGGAGIKLYSVQTPSYPVFVGSYDTGGSVYDLQVEGNTIYVADGTGGFLILAYTPQFNVTEIGVYRTGGTMTSLVVRDDIAYVLENVYYPNSSYLKIIDISNPDNPVLSGTFPIINSSYDLFLQGNYAFVATYNQGIRIIDISDPTSPVETGYYITPGHAFGIAVNGTIAYVGNGEYFSIYDISQAVSNDDPALPVPPVSKLYQSYPNPFISGTEIGYDIAKAGPVNLSIYNTKGQLVRQIVNEQQKNGSYSVTWDGTDSNNNKVSSGVYFFRLETAEGTRSRKCLLLK